MCEFVCGVMLKQQFGLLRRERATAGLSASVATRERSGVARAPEVACIHGRARPIVCSARFISCWLCGLLRRGVRLVHDCVT